jgi:hypothetical protein
MGASSSKNKEKNVNKIPPTLEQQKRGFLQRCKNKQITVAEMNQICPGLNLQAKHLPVFCQELERFEKHPYYLSVQEYEVLRGKKRTLKSRLTGRDIPLVELMPAESVRTCGKKSCMTVYHGTDMKSLNSLLTDLSADVGEGALGQGFYFTPVFEYATYYAKYKAKDSKTDPIVIEFHIIDYEGLRVQLLRTITTLNYRKKVDGPQSIVSQRGDINVGFVVPKSIRKQGYTWQFNCNDTLTLKTHFRVGEVFVLPV